MDWGWMRLGLRCLECQRDVQLSVNDFRRVGVRIGFRLILQSVAASVYERAQCFIRAQRRLSCFWRGQLRHCGTGAGLTSPLSPRICRRIVRNFCVSRESLLVSDSILTDAHWRMGVRVRWKESDVEPRVELLPFALKPGSRGHASAILTSTPFLASTLPIITRV
jgi:hypothetical protein